MAADPVTIQALRKRLDYAGGIRAYGQAVEAAGGGKLHPVHGIDVRAVSTAGDLSEGSYVAAHGAGDRAYVDSIDWDSVRRRGK